MITLEVAPKIRLGLALVVRDVLQGQEHGSVCEIGPSDDVLDGVEHDRAHRIKQLLVLIAIELPCSKPADAEDG